MEVKNTQFDAVIFSLNDKKTLSCYFHFVEGEKKKKTV